MEILKFLIVGDGNVGKTCIIIMQTTNQFPNEYIPTVSDNFTLNFLYHDEQYVMQIWDTAGQEEYAYLRSIAYIRTDVFFVCFSIADPTSYSNVDKKWYPEVRHHCPDAIVILVGTKMDLRQDDATIEKLKKKGRSPITYEQGLRLAERIKAYSYFECSALKRLGLQEIFDGGVLAFFARKARPPTKRNCSIL